MTSQHRHIDKTRHINAYACNLCNSIHREEESALGCCDWEEAIKDMGLEHVLEVASDNKYGGYQ